MRRMTLADLIVTVLLALTLGTFGIATAQVLEDHEELKKCAMNLRQIGQAILLYSNENRGAFPRTIVSGGASPVPTWGTPYEGDAKLEASEKANAFDTKDPAANAPKPNDVSAAFFLLLRTQDITSEVFVCPATDRQKWDFGAGTNSAIHWTNWKGHAGLRDHLGYSYQNPYPSVAAIGAGFKLNNSISAEFAVASDMNPGSDALLKLTRMSKMEEMRAGNSFNHGGDGQMVLYGDGHVEYMKSPFVGIQRDNIFTYGNSEKTGGDGIVGSPVGPHDSILLPAAKHIGVTDVQGVAPDVAMAPPSPEDLAKLRTTMLGKFVRKEGAGAGATLEITAGTIVLTSGGAPGVQV
jgi:hypothetical protein